MGLTLLRRARLARLHPVLALVVAQATGTGEQTSLGSLLDLATTALLSGLAVVAGLAVLGALAAVTLPVLTRRKRRPRGPLPVPLDLSDTPHESVEDSPAGRHPETPAR